MYPLNVNSRNDDHTFRSSYLVAFRGYVAIERLSCDHEPATQVKHVAGQVTLSPGESASAKKYIRIKVSSAPACFRLPPFSAPPLSRIPSAYARDKQINDAVTPVPWCDSGPGGSCPLSSFATYVEKRGATIGDFKTVCGLTSTSNATSELDIYTHVPSTTAQSSVSQVPLPFAVAV